MRDITYRCRLHHPDSDEVAAILDEVRAGAKSRKDIAADHRLTYRRLNLLLKRYAPELIGAAANLRATGILVIEQCCRFLFDLAVYPDQNAARVWLYLNGVSEPSRWEEPADGWFGVWTGFCLRRYPGGLLGPYSPQPPPTPADAAGRLVEADLGPGAIGVRGFILSPANEGRLSDADVEEILREVYG